MDPIESVEYNGFETSNGNSHVDHGWKKVVYPKRHRKQKPADQATANGGKTVAQNGTVANGGDNVFRSLEEQAEDRRRRILAAKMAAVDSDDDGVVRSKRRSNGYGDDGYDFDGSDDEIAARNENLKVEETKKPKVKKVKKPKVSLPEAASKIDPSNLEAFLVEASESYASQPEIQLMRFADYFGRALSGVSSVQFPWVKMFKESPLSKLIDVPLAHIPEPVYKTSVDWINHRPIEALGAFVLWAFDCILTDLAVQQGGAKGGKKGAQPSKSQVAIFVALAMVLRRKPDALTNVLPTLRENPKYQGQDKLPVTVWMMAQASQGDLSVGLYSWAHNLLPVVGNKNCNPQSRDLILQLVEKILTNPKARTILVNGAVRKGERLIPPHSFEILLRLTFPASSARVKATERFEAIYPLLKEVALAGAPGSKAMKQVTQQIFTFALKLAGEGNPVLAKEATAIAIWSVTENVDCCKHWDNLYKENLEASVAVLKKLVEEWKERSVKLSSSPNDALTLNRTMKSFRLKNEEAITEGGANGSLYKEADKSCKVISGRLSRGSGCLKGTAITFVVLAAAGAAAAAVLSSNPDVTNELKNLVDSLELHEYLNKYTEVITTALKK
ncbi:Transmembrane protein 214 [Arabidopsis suecica]|uniref:Transmembrane protein 214 n=1 Tax=Arabidopsis suecica TaxID=45249 RepID=A0A8T2BQJ7_ARASU|nr:Transmembrane protein 214 [Arabidopsis suecica]